jgi:hypothetical protein
VLVVFIGTGGLTFLLFLVGQAARRVRCNWVNTEIKRIKLLPPPPAAAAEAAAVAFQAARAALAAVAICKKIADEATRSFLRNPDLTIMSKREYELCSSNQSTVKKGIKTEQFEKHIIAEYRDMFPDLVRIPTVAAQAGNAYATDSSDSDDGPENKSWLARRREYKRKKKKAKVKAAERVMSNRRGSTRTAAIAPAELMADTFVRAGKCSELQAKQLNETKALMDTAEDLKRDFPHLMQSENRVQAWNSAHMVDSIQDIAGSGGPSSTMIDQYAQEAALFKRERKRDPRAKNVIHL